MAKLNTLRNAFVEALWPKECPHKGPNDAIVENVWSGTGDESVKLICSRLPHRGGQTCDC